MVGNDGKPLGHEIGEEKLAQYSTDRYAGGLYFRVRNGTGCDPAAMAVIPKYGIAEYYIKLSITSESGEEEAYRDADERPD